MLGYKNLKADICHARMKGYLFELNDDRWKLSKDIVVYPQNVTQYLHSDLKEGYVKTLAYFAMEYSDLTHVMWTQR